MSLVLTLVYIFFCNSLSLSTSYSLHFPLTSLRLTPPTNSSSFLSSLLSSRNPSPSPYSFRSNFKYSIALILSLPIGTPSQTQQLVLDTGSQLSWIQCHNNNNKNTKKPTFVPSLSSSFSDLSCSHPLCKPRILDFTLPTSCDSNRLCHYSYFYADGTLAEGNLVKEKITFSNDQITPPLILGCASDDSTDDKGILGMNLGRFSFVSQAKVSKFSYCIPTRSDRPGSFYLGENPNARGFKYVPLLTFVESQRMPNLDPLAYTVPLLGIKIRQKRLDISPSVFRPDAGGSGQTMVDSGSEFTHLVDVAYDKVKEEIVKLVGSRLKKGYVYGGTADMCFDGNNAMEIGRLIGDLVFEFGRGVEILVVKERVLVNVGGGVYCVGIGRSSMLGAASNIIGNVHQQNLWVEFDVTNRRVGFSKTECNGFVP